MVINMDWYRIYVDIIGPIVCALLGGVLTVLGVYLTIMYEKKKDKESSLFNSKPLFYRLDFLQEYDYKSAKDYFLTINKDSNKNKMYGVFQNTDKAYLFLEYAIINNKKHSPVHGNAINKDEIFNLYIYTDEPLLNGDDVILVIKDVFDNKYEYKIEYEIKEDKNVRIISINEFKKNKKRINFIFRLLRIKK